jgi:hypothetical protein
VVDGGGDARLSGELEGGGPGRHPRRASPVPCREEGWMAAGKLGWLACRKKAALAGGGAARGGPAGGENMERWWS